MRNSLGFIVVVSGCLLLGGCQYLVPVRIVEVTESAAPRQPRHQVRHTPRKSTRTRTRSRKRRGTPDRGRRWGTRGRRGPPTRKLQAGASHPCVIPWYDKVDEALEEEVLGNKGRAIALLRYLVRKAGEEWMIPKHREALLDEIHQHLRRLGSSPTELEPRLIDLAHPEKEKE